VSELEDLQNQILDLRYRVERLESKARHTLVEHVEDVRKWHDEHGYLFAKDENVFFTAYERWLNNRQLLTEVSGE
jgi:hypothetical protein